MPVRPPTFRPKGARSHRQVRADQDQRRGSARERGYTARWDAAALSFKREHPLCLGCKAVDRITATEVVDHVEPHEGDMVRFWNRAMWQPACKWHHDVVKQVLERMYRQGKATLDDLWLNSSKAIELTQSMRPPGG